MAQPSMLGEHEPVDKTGVNASEDVYTPSTEEKALVKKLDGLFLKAKKYRSRFDYNWVEYYKLFRGRQWKDYRPTYRNSEVFNLIFQTVQSQVPLLVDAKPKFEYLPMEPGDRDFADLMNDVATSDWQRNNWLYTLTEVVYDANLYGTGISDLVYDYDTCEIKYRSKDLFYFYPNKGAQDLETRCTSITYAEPLDVDYAKTLFPDRAKYIKPDVTDLMSTERIDFSEYRFRSVIADQLELQTTGATDLGNNEVLVKTHYVKDETVLEEEQDGEDGSKTTVRRLKYPKGRKTIVINEMVVYDEANEYEDGKFPYQRLINYINPRNFYGISELEPLESPQRVFNKVVSYVLDVLTLMGNPIWVVSSDSSIDEENLTNQPGLIVTKEPGSEVQRMEGVQLQPYVLQIVDRLKEWFDQISGSQDVTRGIPAGGITAASAIDALQNAAQTRIRLKIKNIDAYLQDLGQQYAARVMQFYTAPQVFRLTGKDGTDKYFKMHIDRNEDGTHTANVQRFTENGTLSPDIEQYQLRGKLDVRVSTGSSLPFSKAQNEDRLFKLFQLGIIDEEEVLKGLDYPNWERVQQRMQEARAQAAQAQAQQDAQKQAGKAVA